MRVPRAKGELVVDLGAHVNGLGCVPASARMVPGKTLGAAPRGASVVVELGRASIVDAAVTRALAAFARRHDFVIRGANPVAVGDVVRELNGGVE